MKLFLASSVNGSLDKVGELLLDKPETLTVAFIPTASNPYGDNIPWSLADKKRITDKGFKLVVVDIVGKTEAELDRLLKNADILCVGGGNTFYLLDHVRKSGFDNIIKRHVEAGKVYMGSSAGSIIMGPTIAPAEPADDPKVAPGLESYEGLHLVDFVVLPHVNSEEDVAENKRIADSLGYKQYKFVMLNDSQVVIVNGYDCKIV